jgi:hypothetical protein
MPKKMNAWKILKEEEYILAWDDFDLKFDFHPSTRKKDWPGIKEPNPSLTFRISHIFGKEKEHYKSLNDNLMDIFLQAFKSLLPKYGWIFALNWQHECYKFYPHFPFELNKYGEWMVPILPNGDYYIFFEKNLNFGVFGHPWEGTMCIFGKELITNIEQNTPSIFTEKIRVNGKTI